MLTAHLPQCGAALLVLGACAALSLWGAGLEYWPPLLLGGQRNILGEAGRHLHIGSEHRGLGQLAGPVSHGTRSKQLASCARPQWKPAHLLPLELASLHCLFAAIGNHPGGNQQGIHARSHCRHAVAPLAGSATTGQLLAGWQRAGTYTQAVDFKKLVHW